MTFTMKHLEACAKAEAESQARRLEDGIDPDEHTIYNVLCPEIRSKWSKREEYKRRVLKTGHVGFNPVHESVLLGT